MLNPYQLSTVIRAHNEGLEQSARAALRDARGHRGGAGRSRRLISILGALLVTAGLRLQGQA